MSTSTLLITPSGVADAVETVARRVSESYIAFTGQKLSFETLIQDFLLTPRDCYSAYTHNRAYSLNNDLVRLQTSLSVLMDTADAVAMEELGLEDRAGLMLRWEIDRGIRLSRRLIDKLALVADNFGIDTDAPIFQLWPHASRELVARHPLYDSDNEEFH